MTNIQKYNDEINVEIAKPEIQRALLATTFNGLNNLVTMKKAMLEGMMRGFTFKDFLEKNVYAIPFKDNYSLVTSIDYGRKIGMRSGVVGKSAPLYGYDKDGNLESCTITIKRKVNEYVGEYTATVDFKEYSTGRNLWATKPKTMICKVAEMHALRSACPEELSQAYIEEDYQKEESVDLLEEGYKTEIDAITEVEKLKEYYHANKGKGKDFDKYVTKRKKELESA